MFIIFAWRMMCINFVGPSFSLARRISWKNTFLFIDSRSKVRNKTSKGYVHKFQLEVWQKKIRHIIKFDHLPTYLVPQLPTTMLRLIWCPQQHLKIHWISIEFTYATNSPTSQYCHPICLLYRAVSNWSIPPSSSLGTPYPAIPFSARSFLSARGSDINWHHQQLK